ncbi:MAG: hypothetical protein EORIYHIE_002623, partial [Candidatus Fervidibacter sp.]
RDLVPSNLSVPHAPGLAEWQGREFGEAMRLCIRIYPHHLDSGGLFLAKLRRLP